MNTANAMESATIRLDNVSNEVDTFLRNNIGPLRNLLPPEVSAGKLRALIWTSLQSTPKLVMCSVDSIIGCVYEAAKCGLEPDTAAGECYLIPRAGKATFQLGYQGAMILAERAHQGILFRTQVVCEKDDFDWDEGLNQKLTHKRHRGQAADRGKIEYAYAIATFADGREPAIKVVDSEDIVRARLTAKSDAWKTHPGAMWEKTAILRLCKRLSKRSNGAIHIAGRQLARAVQLDDASDDGRDQELSLERDIERKRNMPAFDSEDDSEVGVVEAVVVSDAPQVCDVCHVEDGHGSDDCPGAS